MLLSAPISLDIALDKECADIKGFESPVAGDADVILVPNIQVGNSILENPSQSLHRVTWQAS